MSQRRGASLIEVMVAVAILAVLGTGLLISSSQGRARASSQALAERMAEVFKQARESAIAQGGPVAVLLPCTPASPLANSYATADGTERAIVRKSASFAQELPGTYLFAGHWPLASGVNASPSPLAGANGAEFDLSSWPLPPGQAAYVYTPAGTLTSNQVEFGGAYHLVVCQSAEWSAQAVNGTPSARLSAVSSPVTLRLSKAGGVSVVPSLEEQSGVTTEAAALTISPLAAVAPLFSDNARPTLDKVDLYPEAEPDTVPADVKATVASDGYITLKVEASDPDGDPLAVSWSVVQLTGAGIGAGAVSSPVRTRTEQAGSKQTSVWEWKPPVGSKTGDLFELSVDVRDPGNLAAAGGALAMCKVETVDPGTILFADNRSGDRELYTMNNDGTNEMRLTHTPGADEDWPQLSPDGSRVMYVKQQGGAGVLMTVGIDGKNPKRLLRPSDLPNHAGPPVHAVDSIVGSCWSPDGSRIAVIARYAGATGGLDVYTCNADGTNAARAHSPTPVGGLSVTWAVKVTWHFDFPYQRDRLDKQRLLFTSPYDHHYFAFFLDGRTEQEYDPGRDVYDINVGPNGKVAWIEGGQLRVGQFTEGGGLGPGTVLAGGLGGTPAAPAWSPVGDRLVFSNDNGPTRIYRVNADGGDLVRLTNTGTALEACWGP